jgi:predicted transcriptional regulator
MSSRKVERAVNIYLLLKDNDRLCSMDIQEALSDTKDAIYKATRILMRAGLVSSVKDIWTPSNKKLWYVLDEYEREIVRQKIKQVI